MFIFLVRFVDLLFQAITLAIIGRALLSWFPIRPGNPFYPVAAVLFQLTEPILAPLRRVIPRLGMLDITPLVALFLLQFIQSALLSAIVRLAR